MKQVGRHIGYFFALTLIAGCKGEEVAETKETPPAEVGVVVAFSEVLPVVSELPARISPTRISEVRPRVGGIIVERVFEQRTTVAAGDPLFRVDAAVFEVEVEEARAGVARAEAQHLRARQEAERARLLIAREAISQGSFESTIANEKEAQADLAAVRARLHAAQINLDYTTVTAPISGQIGRAMVTEGALVSSTGGDALATIQQIDPIYTDIQQPIRDLMMLRQALRDGTLKELEPGVAEVRLMLDDGSLYAHAGKLLFSEASVERLSGQVTLRAEFPNPDGTLLPGLYVRVSVDQGVESDVIAVPTQAIQRGSAGAATVLVVADDDTVETRPVSLGRVFQGRTIIVKGLAEGDSVIVDGFQKIGPGAPVSPVPWTDTLAQSTDADHSASQQE